MWLELLLFRRYLVGVHYFYIYAKQRSKWTSGKINYSYLLYKIVVSHTSVMYNHGIYECITIWYVFELLLTILLIAYLLRDLWHAIFIGYLSVQRYNSVNSFSIVYPVDFQMPLLMPHGMCWIHSCCSGVLSLHLSHRRWY